MRKTTGLKNLKKLSISQLKHLLQQCEDDIKNYEKTVQNYTVENWVNYGSTHYSRLLEDRDKVQARLDELREV